MPGLRVAFVVHDTQLYGANRSLLSLVVGLREHGVSSFVLCPSRGKLTMKLEEHDVPFSVLPFRKWWIWMHSPSLRLKLTQPGRLAFILATLPLIVGQLSKWKPDIVYTNSPLTPVGALAALAMGKPHVWHIRELGWLDYGIKCEYGRAVFKYWLNKASAVIAISNSVKREVLEGVKTATHVIYNGVVTRSQCEDLGNKALSSKRAGRYTFALVGLLHPNKGQEQAIMAMELLHKRHPEARLIIVGSGEMGYAARLRQLTESLGLERQVEHWGFISDPFRAYLEADAVLMCSRYEAMGRVTAEAMAAARPVIGYNSTGTAEIVEDGVTGVLYNGSHERLAESMARFMENPEWARNLGVNGWNKAKKEFIIETYAEKVYSVLKQIAGH